MKRLAFTAILVLALSAPQPSNAAGPCVRTASVAAFPADDTRPSGVYATAGMAQCPIGTFTVSVSLQRLDTGTWTTVATASTSASFSRYYRLARQLGATASIGGNSATQCVEGTYRGYAQGSGDGEAPEWSTDPIQVTCQPTIVPPPPPTPTPEPAS